MKRRIIALLLTFVMLASITTALAETEPNDSKSTADEVSIDSMCEGVISSSTDVDWYKIEIPYTGKINLSLSGNYDDWYTEGIVIQLISPSDYRIKVVNSSGVEVDNGYAQSTSNPRSVGVSAGTYYIVVSKYGSGDNYIHGKEYYVSTSFTCSHINKTEYDVSESTCSVQGTVETRCDDCEAVVKTQYLPLLDHTPDGEWVTTRQPTCSDAGQRLQYCVDCGEIAVKESIETLPHDASWEVTRDPTCTTTGSQRYVCAECGQVVRTETIDMVDHLFGLWKEYTKATCTKEGAERRYCEDCNEYESRVVEPLGHDFDEWIIDKEATCTVDGKRHRICRDCREREDEELTNGNHITAERDIGTVGGVRTYETYCTECGDVFGSAPYEDETQYREEVTKVGSSEPTIIFIIVPTFTDVPSDSWFMNVVTYAYSLGLMRGDSDTIFNPNGNMTVAEAITMAARVRNSYDGGTNTDFVQTGVWYQVYVDYALEKGIIKAGDFNDYNRAATRAEMAYIFANALPESETGAINTVTTLPDVKETDRYGAEIFELYRAGVFTGSDDKGTFKPDSPIIRAEAAAIITRIMLKSERKTLNLG